MSGLSIIAGWWGEGGGGSLCFPARCIYSWPCSSLSTLQYTLAGFPAKPEKAGGGGGGGGGGGALRGFTCSGLESNPGRTSNTPSCFLLNNEQRKRVSFS